MERLGDDELRCIFKKIPYKYKDNLPNIFSLIQVSKQFMRAACIRLYVFHCSVPDMLFDILPSSPYMTSFVCYKPLSNTHLKLLAHSCPNLLVLDLILAQGEHDFDDDGLCAVGNSCKRLCIVNLRKRLRVGDAGIVSLVTSCKDLINLGLEGCIRVTDESLKAIGKSGICSLNLGGCYMIMDSGLKHLASGNLKKCLDRLNLAQCDRISDNGVIHLKQMVGLTELNLSECGVHVTDSGIVAILSQLPNIRMLDLSWLINVTDISLLAIGKECLELIMVYLTGCEAITAKGLRAFSGHKSLMRLVLFSCYKFTWEDVESVALSCVRLRYLGLMKKIKRPMPQSSYEFFQIGDNTCKIEWDKVYRLVVDSTKD